MVNFEGILSFDLFWAYEGDVKVGVRDIYALEFQILKKLPTRRVRKQTSND